jgi:hypothetical protein
MPAGVLSRNRRQVQQLGLHTSSQHRGACVGEPFTTFLLKSVLEPVGLSDTADSYLYFGPVVLGQGEALFICPSMTRRPIYSMKSSIYERKPMILTTNPSIQRMERSLLGMHLTQVAPTDCVLLRGGLAIAE